MPFTPDAQAGMPLLTDETRRQLAAALDALTKAGLNPLVTSTGRSYDQQAALYRRFQQGDPSIQLAAPPGGSKHESGTAVDITFADPRERQAANSILAQHGFQWFGPGDRVHYTYTGNAGVTALIPPAGADPLARFQAAGPSGGADPLAQFKAAAPAPAPVQDPLAQFKAAGPAAGTGGDLLAQFKAAGPASGAPARGRLGQALPAGFYGGQQTAPAPQPRHVSVPTGTIPGVMPPGGIGAAMPPQAIDTRQTAVPKPVQAAERGFGRVITAVTTPISTFDAFVNQVAHERAQIANRKGQGLDIGDEQKAVVRALLKTPWAATIKQGLTGKQFVGFEPVSTTRQEMKGGEGAALRKAPPWVSSVADLLLSFPAQEIPGVAQSELVGAAGRALAKLDAATGASQKLLDKLPAVRDAIESRQAYQHGQEILNKHAAAAEHEFLPAAAANAEDLRQTSQKYLKAGVPIRGVNPYTRQPLNELDALVGDYIDAGAPGAKHEALGSQAAQLRQVQAEAAAKGIDYADVARIGDAFGAQLDTLGQRLVDHGLLDASSYQALKGQYLPRLYLMTKGSAEDVTAYLKFLDEQGALTAAGKRELLQEVGSKQRYSQPGAGPQAFTKQREIATFAERNNPAAARAAIPEATPAALHGIAAQTRAVGEAEGHAEIAANPFLAQPVATAPAHYANFPGKGPLAGMAIHPGIARMLEVRSQPDLLMEFVKQTFGQKAYDYYNGANRGLRKALLGAPKSAFNIVTGHYDLLHNAAAIHHVSFGVPQMGAAWRELRAASRGVKAGSYLEEALTRTDLLREANNLIPKEAKAVGHGFGVETRAQNARSAARKTIGAVLGAPRAVTHDVLAAGRYGLYKALRQSGKGIDEAARITRNAAINYSDTGPLRRALERHALLGAPFITFPTKAVGQYLNTALRRPDLFSTSTGQRARNFLDTLADQYAREHGQQPVAREKRRKGEAGLSDFPIPGSFDAAGRQQYARAGLLAPALHHIIRGGEEVNPLQEMVNNAAPALRLGREVMNNAVQHNGETHPIVPEGSVAGTRTGPLAAFTNPEVAAGYAGHIARSLVPAYGDLEELVKAARGQPRFPGLGSPVPTVGGAVLRAITGTRTGAEIGRNPLEKQMMTGEALQQAGVLDSPYTRFALSYTNDLFAKQQGNPTYTPDADLQRVADSYSGRTLIDAQKNAERRLTDLVANDTSSGDERKAKIRRYVNWVWALAVAQVKQVQAQAGSLTPGERQHLPAIVTEGSGEG